MFICRCEKCNLQQGMEDDITSDEDMSDDDDDVISGQDDVISDSNMSSDINFDANAGCS